MQINGIAMGWHSAPVLADLFVFDTLEKHTVNRSTIGSGFYSRLLDDGLVILPTTKTAENLLERMKIVNPILKFTHEIGGTANFSDIFLKFKNSQLIRGVYTKPTSNLLVIHARSDHPYRTKIAVIKARFRWFMRCCNGTQELLSITNNFILKLQILGYGVQQIWKTAKEVYSIS